MLPSPSERQLELLRKQSLKIRLYGGDGGSLPPLPSIKSPPIAEFTYSQPSGTLIQFTDDSIATASGATIVAWVWDFDGNASSGDENPTFDYGSEGNYQVVLTVTDSNGKVDTVSKIVSVAGSGPGGVGSFSDAFSDAFG